MGWGEGAGRRNRHIREQEADRLHCSLDSTTSLGDPHKPHNPLPLCLLIYVTGERPRGEVVGIKKLTRFKLSIFHGCVIYGHSVVNRERLSFTKTFG